jgi:hypothetical protein
LHKGFKCLDVTTGRIYISCDVTFDEEVFPFSKLHLNAGAKLRSEVHLLPDLFPVQPMRSGHDNVADPRPNDSPANQLFGENFDVQDQELLDAQEQNQANEQEFPPQPSPPATSPLDSVPANTTTTTWGSTSTSKFTSSTQMAPPVPCGPCTTLAGSPGDRDSTWQLL